ncbi:hypothetical protein CEXT_755931 [Caerostris extrusa]|uniref:Uncharacterized protein n=1 Tax=Caerostris extrusa TaxID=172846 RepID=A0AAV4R9U6_CAEEX|nr:hypothetical protein CEXT_755931 [Caerostris extrusa]
MVTECVPQWNVRKGDTHLGRHPSGKGVPERSEGGNRTPNENPREKFPQSGDRFALFWRRSRFAGPRSRERMRTFHSRARWLCTGAGCRRLSTETVSTKNYANVSQCNHWAHHLIRKNIAANFLLVPFSDSDFYLKI